MDALKDVFVRPPLVCLCESRCSRKHVYPTASPTLMIRGMFKTFGMDESRRDDYDTDAWLEHSEDDLQESFLEFYHDVLPEFKSLGKVLQFKVRRETRQSVCLTAPMYLKNTQLPEVMSYFRKGTLRATTIFCFVTLG